MHLKADYLSPGPFFAGLIVLFRLIRLGMRHKAAGREHMPAPDVPRVAAREHLPISEYFKSVPNGKPERPRTVSFAAIGPKDTDGDVRLLGINHDNTDAGRLRQRYNGTIQAPRTLAFLKRLKAA